MITQDIHPAMQGIVPATIVTCSKSGEPNTTVISQVFYVDDTHVALSFQFFNKTIRNVRENAKAIVQIMHPATFQSWALEIEFKESQTEGDIFDQMDMQLEAIASMSGMSGIFKLHAADIYEVKSIQPVNY